MTITRTVGEEVWIGDHVCVRVIFAKNNEAKLVITAPKEIPIRRGELSPLQRIHQKADLLLKSILPKGDV